MNKRKKKEMQRQEAVKGSFLEGERETKKRKGNTEKHKIQKLTFLSFHCSSLYCRNPSTSDRKLDVIRIRPLSVTCNSETCHHLLAAHW